MNSNIFIIAFLLMNIGLTAPVFASQPLGSLDEADQAPIGVKYLVPEGFEDLTDTREINIYFFKKIIAYATVSGVGDARYITLDDEIIMVNDFYGCDAGAHILNLLPCESDGIEHAIPLAQFNLSSDDKVAEYANLIPARGYEDTFYRLYNIDPSQDRTPAQHQDEYIPESSVQQLSGFLGYSAALSHSLTDASLNGSISLNSLMGYGNYSLKFDPYINFSQSGSNVNINTLLATYIHQGVSVESGVQTSSSTSGIRRAQNLVPASKIAGVWFSSFDQTKQLKNIGTMTPIEIYMPTAGKIEVRNGQRLLYVGSFEAGAISIPTDSFPVGVYDVIIKRLPHSMTELPMIEQRVNNSQDQESVKLALGVAKLNNNYDATDSRYDQAYVSLEGIKQLTDGVTLRSSATLMGDLVYGSLGTAINRFSFMDIDLDAMYASNDSWSAGFYTESNLNSMLDGLSVSVSGSYTDDEGNKSNNISLNLNYRLNGRYADSLRLSYYRSEFDNLIQRGTYADQFANYVDYIDRVSAMENMPAAAYMNEMQEDDSYQDTYHQSSSDFSLYVDKSTYWFGMPVYLSANIGRDNINDFRFGIGVNVNFGKPSQDYTVTARFENNAGGNNASIYAHKNDIGSTYIDSAQVGVQSYDGGYGIDMQGEVENALFRGNLNLSTQFNKGSNQYQSQASLWLSGGMVYDASHLAFTNNQHMRSAYIFNLDNNDDEIELFASVSNSSQGVQLRGNSNVLPLKSFYHHEIYMNALGGVLPEEQAKITDVFYPGNFKFVDMVPRKTIEVAGMYQVSARSQVLIKNHESQVLIKNHESQVLIKNHESQVLIKNHESQVLIKNHESQVLIKNHESQTELAKSPGTPLFFQLTVSKRYPTIEIYHDEQYMCTKNIEDELDVADLLGQHFVYLSDVSC